MQHPKYKIIFNGHHDLTAFEKEVMANMKTGWIPVGGIAVDKGALYQAMIYNVLEINAASTNATDAVKAVKAALDKSK